MALLGPQVNGKSHTDRIDVGVSFGSLSLRDRYRNVKVYIVHMTPSLAEMYLASNVRNRPLNKTHVAQMRQVIESGDMVMNGETIIIGIDGTLLNGQHRLTACVQSGVGFDAMVVEGIDIDAFRTLDGGRKRGVGDVLAMDGEALPNKLAAAVQAIVAFIDRKGVVVAGIGHGVRKATPQLTERVLRAHPGIRSSVDAMSRSKLYANQQGYTLHYLFSLVSVDLAGEFAAVLADGHSDIERPFVVLRETLILNHNHNYLRSQNAAKAIKAFNAELSGQRPKILRIFSSEVFPRIDGLDYESLSASVK